MNKKVMLHDIEHILSREEDQIFEILMLEKFIEINQQKTKYAKGDIVLFYDNFSTVKRFIKRGAKLYAEWLEEICAIGQIIGVRYDSLRNGYWYNIEYQVNLGEGSCGGNKITKHVSIVPESRVNIAKHMIINEWKDLMVTKAAISMDCGLKFICRKILNSIFDIF